MGYFDACVFCQHVFGVNIEIVGGIASVAFGCQIIFIFVYDSVGYKGFSVWMLNRDYVVYLNVVKTGFWADYPIANIQGWLHAS